jgi:hypothetical protein
MNCINPECHNEQDVSDLTICSNCYEQYYLEEEE